MMDVIRKQPIKVKLMLIIMLTSLVCLLLTGVAVVVYERYHVKRDLVNDISALAMLIADRSTAALTFQDPRLAEENLAALHVKPAVVAACILNENGEVFAKYNTIDSGEFNLAVVGKKQGHRFSHEHLLLYVPISFGWKQIGTVCIYADLKEFYKQRSYFMLLVATAILFSCLIALYLSSRLQLVVSRPLRRLTETTQSIAAKKNFSLRAEKDSDDEIGILVDAFNEMLAMIEKQNMNLKESEELYRTLFENTGTAAALIEENSIISLINAEFAKLSQYAKQEIEGKKNWSEFVVKEDLERMQAQHRLRRGKKEEALKQYEFRFIARDGNIRNILLTIDVIPGHQKKHRLAAGYYRTQTRRNGNQDLECRTGRPRGQTHHPIGGGQQGTGGLFLFGLPRPARPLAPRQRLCGPAGQALPNRAVGKGEALFGFDRRFRAPDGGADRRPAAIFADRARGDAPEGHPA